MSRNCRSVAFVGQDAGVAEVERALERLFRLSMSRKAHGRQAAAVGAVVTRAGFAVLRSLQDGGPSTLADIAGDCAMDPAAAVRQISGLEAEGLVERTTSDADRRVKLVRLTRRGRAVHRRIVAVRIAYMADVLADWSDADRATLARLVDRVVDDLGAVPFGAGRERTRGGAPS